MPTDATIKRDDEQDDGLSIRGIQDCEWRRSCRSRSPLPSYPTRSLFGMLGILGASVSSVLVITMGCLQLTLTVVLDSGVPRGIPWAFVRNFARKMRAMTGLGFPRSNDVAIVVKTHQNPHAYSLISLSYSLGLTHTHSQISHAHLISYNTLATK